MAAGKENVIFLIFPLPFIDKIGEEKFLGMARNHGKEKENDMYNLTFLRFLLFFFCTVLSRVRN